MGFSKTSQQAQTTELPPELQQASIDNLALAKQIGMMPYIPNFGLSIAALTPQQIAAMQGAAGAASAFGLPGGDVGMPPAQSVGGFSGYSTKPLYDASYAAIPDAVKALLARFIEQPVTAAPQPTTAKRRIVQSRGPQYRTAR